VSDETGPDTGLDLAAVMARLDTSVPHPARRYNYWLGGKDNFAADRESGDQIAQFAPSVRVAAIENRKFQRRVVRFLAREAGIRQFLDIGTGIPGPENTHEVAQAVDPRARVVYVDNDPVVLSHARALLTSAPGGATAYIDADVREPEKVLSHPDLLSTLDLSQPVGLLLIALVHFLTDADDAYGKVATLVRALPPGSYLAMTSATQDFMTPAEVEEADAAVASGRHGSFRFRTRAEFARFFDGHELVPPGIETIAYWRSDEEPEPRPAPKDAAAWAALARIG
jgi:hypothetical protein